MGRDLYHSSEGQTWRKHKYIRKEGNRYIYPEDVRKESTTNWARRDQISEKQMQIEQGIRDRNNRQGVRRAENSHKLVANGGKAEHTKKQLNDSHDQAKKDVSKLNTSGFVAMHQPKNFDKNGNPKRWRSTVNMNREAEAKAEDRFKKNAKTAVPASVKDQQRSVRMDERRRNSSNQMPESDRRTARQVQNREDAANGMRVNKYVENYMPIDKQDYSKKLSEDWKNGHNRNLNRFRREKQQSENRSAAANGAGAKNQEYAKAANAEQKAKRQAKNRAAAANGNIIGKNGKVYTFRQDQDYAKRNTGGKKSEQYQRDYAQNEDGSYGAKEGQYWKWTTDKHTHSSEAARKAGIEKKAYEAEVKEAVKKTKARNKDEKEKLTKKGKQIVDKIKSTFSKKKK